MNQENINDFQMINSRRPLSSFLSRNPLAAITNFEGRALPNKTVPVIIQNDNLKNPTALSLNPKEYPNKNSFTDSSYKSLCARFSESASYIEDVIENMKQSQVFYMPNTQYLLKQTQINEKMRSILIEWMIEVSEEYRLEAQTLHLAVNLVDRFLCMLLVPKDKLQLLGASSIYIASKQLEIFPPEAKDLAYITDDTYSVSQVIQMEKFVLHTMKYRIICPTILDFIDVIFYRIYNFKFVQDSTYNELRSFSMYVGDLCLLDYNQMINYKYSMSAQSTIIVCSNLLQIKNSNIEFFCKSIDNESIEILIACQRAVYSNVKNVIDNGLYSSVTNKHCALRFHQLVTSANYPIQVKWCHDVFVE